MLLLIPQRFIDGVTPQRRTRTGKAAEVAILLLIGLGVIAGLTSMARADDQQGAGEYAGHNAGDGTGYAHECRPSTAVARDLMQELVCTCGGCQRESLYQCKCGFAAQRRCEVLEMLAGEDIESAAGRQAAYDKVVANFVKEHGERVLNTPKSKLSWGVPVAAAGGALLLIFGFGRMWVRRGQRQLSDRTEKLSSNEEDDEYGDILDDELRETD